MKQSHGDSQGGLLEEARNVIGLAGVGARLIELFVRQPGTPGCRHWGISACVAPALPALFGVRADPVTGFVVPDYACAMAFWIVLGAMFFQSLASKRNDVEHSRYIGDTLGCDENRPGVELCIGLALSASLYLVSEALSSIFLISTICNAINVAVLRAQQDIVVLNARDARLRGRILSRQLRSR